MPTKKLKLKPHVFTLTGKDAAVFTTQLVSYDHANGSKPYVDTTVTTVCLRRSELLVPGYLKKVKAYVAEYYPTATVSFAKAAGISHIKVALPEQRASLELDLQLANIKDGWGLRVELRHELLKLGLLKYAEFGGHTRFLSDNNMWRSYDALGVSDSFYGDTLTSQPADWLPRELARIERSRARILLTVEVPGLAVNRRYTPAELDIDKTKLKDGGILSFMPHGFGTAYYLSKRSNRYARSAPADTCKFFGFKPGELCCETAEMD